MTMSSQEVEKIKVFSKELSQTREITIYKPLGYDDQGGGTIGTRPREL